MSSRRRKKNPASDHTGYWVALGALLVGGVAFAAWKSMSDADRKKTLPG